MLLYTSALPGADMADQTGRIFISYSWKDQDTVLAFRNALVERGFTVWMDVDIVYPGLHIAKAIEEGLHASDYYVVFISESSAASNWVRREISLAITLADKNKLTPIPIILDSAEVPIEFSGLLYIDARSSIANGIGRLLDYFTAQTIKIADLEERILVLKSEDPITRARMKCQSDLRQLTPGDLRFHMVDRFDLSQVKTLWFDMFFRKMEDEVQVVNLPLSVIELLDRVRREDDIAKLLDLICRSYPKFSVLISPKT
jgi:TIR domain